MIEIKNVKKAYQGKEKEVLALNGINLKLPNTGFVSIYGENGCGKTTLLNAISSLDEDYSGEILYNGTDTKKIKDFYRGQIVSFVFQENFFVPYLNLRDNLCLAPEATDERYLAELSSFQIEEKKDDFADNLSGGQKQRSSLIRGLMRQYKVLLVDEPTSSMNEEMETEVFNRLRAIAEDHLVIMVSHNISLIRAYSDMVINMDKATIRSVERNKVTNAVAEKGNILYVPSDFHDLSIVPAYKVREIIEKYGEVRIKTRESSDEDKHFDYSYKIAEGTDRALVMEKNKGNRILKKSLFSATKRWMLSWVLMTLLIALTGIVVSLVAFDTEEFVYKMLNENIVGYACFAKDGNVYSFDKGYKSFNLKEFKSFAEKGDLDFLIMLNYEQSIQASDAVDPRWPVSVYGINLYVKTPELVAGSEPGEGEMLITDYIADEIILRISNYTTYDDILEKGLRFDEKPVKISGIIKTNYKFFENNPAYEATQLAIDVGMNKSNLYMRFYQPLSWYENADDTITGFLIDYGKLPITVKLYDGEIGPEDAYVSEDLQDFMPVGREEKISGLGYVNVVGTVKNAVSTIYVSREKMTAVKAETMSHIAMIEIADYNKEEVAYLRTHGYEHDVSISAFIKSMTDIVEITTRLLFFIALMLFGILLVVVGKMLRELTAADNRMIVMLRMSGYGWKTIRALEIKKLCILMVSAMPVSILFAVLISRAIGAILKSSAGFGVALTLIKWPLMIPVLLGMVIFLLASYFVWDVRNKNKNLIEFRK